MLRRRGNFRCRYRGAGTLGAEASGDSDPGFWDNLNTPELAEFLGCSEGTAGVRIHRAKKAFAKIMPSPLEKTTED
jgi:hypothetical protein